MSFFIWLVGVAALDQLTKALALHYLDPYAPVHVIPSCFWLTLRYNTGAAFSLFEDHPAVLTVINTIASIGIVVYAHFIPRREKLARTGLAILAGGAVGNLIDRFFRGAKVVDFLDFHLAGRHWPTFNVADSAICVGVGLLMIDFYRKYKEEKMEMKKAESESSKS